MLGAASLEGVKGKAKTCLAGLGVDISRYTLQIRNSALTPKPTEHTGGGVGARSAGFISL